MEPIWLKHYPAAVPRDVNVSLYPSLVDLLDTSFKKNADKPVYLMMGKSLSFAQVDEASRALAAYLQSLGLEKGDRVAIMMPNLFQYPVAVAAVLRAGFVVVNVNPLYTPRELEHQLKDSGAKAIVIIENFASVLQQVIKNVPTKHVILAAMQQHRQIGRVRVHAGSLAGVLAQLVADGVLQLQGTEMRVADGSPLAGEFAGQRAA